MDYTPTTRELIGAAYRDEIIDYDAGFRLSDEEGMLRMRGAFVVRADHSYLHLRSEIFNTVSAVILFNQVTLAALLETSHIEAHEGIPGLGRLLLRTVSADCRQMITPASATDFDFSCAMESRGGRRRYRAWMSLTRGAFELEGVGVLTAADHHDLAAANGLAKAS